MSLGRNTKFNRIFITLRCHDHEFLSVCNLCTWCFKAFESNAFITSEMVQQWKTAPKSKRNHFMYSWWRLCNRWKGPTCVFVLRWQKHVFINNIGALVWFGECFFQHNFALFKSRRQSIKEVRLMIEFFWSMNSSHCDKNDVFYGLFHVNSCDMLDYWHRKKKNTKDIHR